MLEIYEGLETALTLLDACLTELASKACRSLFGPVDSNCPDARTIGA